MMVQNYYDFPHPSLHTLTEGVLLSDACQASILYRHLLMLLSTMVKILVTDGAEKNYHDGKNSNNSWSKRITTL